MANPQSYCTASTSSVMPFVATWAFILAVFVIFLWIAEDFTKRDAELERKIDDGLDSVRGVLEEMHNIVEESITSVKDSLAELNAANAADKDSPRLTAMAKALELFLTERISRCKTEMKSDELGVESQRAAIENAMASHTPERVAELGLQKQLDDFMTCYKQRRAIQLERLEQFTALRDEIAETTDA
jgi:hypothetical protein